LSTNTVYSIFGRVAQAANHVMQYVEMVCKLKKDRNCSYSLQPNNFKHIEDVHVNFYDDNQILQKL
jgi:hypothetical protein